MSSVLVTVRRMMAHRCATPLIAAGCAAVLALTGCSQSSGRAAVAAGPLTTGPTYTLMQTNLCLSGLAGCYGRVQYPAG